MPQGLARKFTAWMRTAVARPLAGAFLAQSCALCHLPSGNSPICPACTKDLPVLPDIRCERCALPLPVGQPVGAPPCPDCHRHPPRFNSATAAWVYAFPVDTLIRDFKYGHHLYLGRFFADHLALALAQAWRTSQQPRPDLIIPMPLHPNRLRSRGFNQAAEIARHLARCLKIPCAYNALIRMHDTPPQAGLPREARWHNLLGAFACPTRLDGHRVLLVDDVLTTGASLSACAEMLREAGATHVEVAVVARTPTPDSLESIANF